MSDSKGAILSQLDIPQLSNANFYRKGFVKSTMTVDIYNFVSEICLIC